MSEPMCDLSLNLYQETTLGDESININTKLVLTDQGVADALNWIEHVLRQAVGNNQKFGSKESNDEE